MKKTTVLLVLLVLFSLSLSGCGVARSIANILHFGENEDLYYGATAQQWLTMIHEKAAVWREDAYFYGISDAEVRKDGSSDKWNYLYYSPGAEKTIVFTYNNGFISQKEVALQPLGKIKNFNIDSPTAINIAREKDKTFLDRNSDATIIISLIGPAMDSYSNTGRWLVKFYGSTEKVHVLIDANSGKILN